MSTLKSSAEHLTLNADGSGNDIKFQSNATEVAAIDQAGNLTLSGTVDGVDVAARDAILTSTTTTAGAALPKAGGTMTGALIVDKTNNGYSGARFHDDSGGDYNSYIDLGRDQSGTRLTIRRGGRVQNQTPWTNATPTPIVSFANGGIAFGTDTATANTLDDYEEGTWTPVVTGSTGTPSSVTYHTNPSGNYTKVGRQVTIAFYLHINALTGGSGSFNITGAPFAPMSSDGGFKGTVSMYYANSSSHSDPVLQINSTSTITLGVANGANGWFSNVAWTNAPLSAFGTQSAMAGTLTYFV